MHWCRQTGTQEYDVNLYQQVHFALWEQVIATQPRTEGQHQDRTPVWRLRGLNPAASVSARAVLKKYSLRTIFRSAFCIKWSPRERGSLYLLSLNLTSITIRKFSLMVLSKLKGLPIMTSPDGDKGVNSAFGLQCRSCCSATPRPD